MSDTIVDVLAVERIDFNSISIDKVAYDREERTLYVQFKTSKKTSKKVYSYLNVQESTFNTFVNADSLNFFWAQYISGWFDAGKPSTGVLTLRDQDTNPFSTDGPVAIDVINPARFTVSWKTDDMVSSGLTFNPEFSALCEEDALAQFNSQVSAVFGGLTNVKIVSVTHHFD